MSSLPIPETHSNASNNIGKSFRNFFYDHWHIILVCLMGSIIYQHLRSPVVIDVEEFNQKIVKHPTSFLRTIQQQIKQYGESPEKTSIMEPLKNTLKWVYTQIPSFAPFTEQEGDIVAIDMRVKTDGTICQTLTQIKDGKEQVYLCYVHGMMLHLSEKSLKDQLIQLCQNTLQQEEKKWSKEQLAGGAALLSSKEVATWKGSAITADTYSFTLIDLLLNLLIHALRTFIFAAILISVASHFQKNFDIYGGEKNFWKEQWPKKTKKDKNNPRAGKIIPTSFDQIAGLREQKEEVLEIVDFLRNPHLYKKIGAKIPKGALFIGIPGTGKTLLARAIASESEVLFLSISGSELVRPLVGGGVIRVKSIFEYARKHAPCIIFIDEIESIGKKRRGSYNNGTEEATLNHLLSEMDGIEQQDSDKPIIVIGATNQAESLDSALLRPGRLNSQILFERPDLKDRKQLFKVILKQYPHQKVDIHELATHTAGLVGADIQKICNEAAIFAVRQKRMKVTHKDLWESIDRFLSGREKRGLALTERDKWHTAVHEAGHALVGWLEKSMAHLTKLTIIPRTYSLGHARYAYPEKYDQTEEEMLGEVAVSLGGRAAEIVLFGKNYTAGARSDLESANSILHKMATKYGMAPNLPHFSEHRHHNNQLYKPYSEKTAELIDNYKRTTLEEIFNKKVLPLLKDKKELLEKLAKELLAKETLSYRQVEAILGPRPKGSFTMAVMRGVAEEKPSSAPSK